MDTIPQEPEEVIGYEVETAMERLGKRVDIEGSVRYSGALRRKRVIQSGLDLLRFVFLYSLSDYSLRMVGLWGTVQEWGSLCKSGLRKRLRQCQPWIGMLIVSVLLGSQRIRAQKTGLRLRLIDVTNVSQPGSHQIDWRLHMSFEPDQVRIGEVQLSDGSQGESLTRWQFQPNEVILADRIYGVPRSLGVLLGAKAFFAIRIGWQNLPVQDWEGQPFAISRWLSVQSRDPAHPPAQVSLWVCTPQGRFPIRLVAQAIPPEKAEQIRRHLRAEAKRKKTRLDERTLLAAGFVLLASNLPEADWTAGEILAVYRFRWQIELVFKRLKGLLSFDHLRASDPQLAQTYLLSKILVALLLGEAQWRIALASPATFEDPDRPVSLWRLTQLLHETFRQAVCGSLTLAVVQKHWPQLDRYLCDEPRRRRSQLASLHLLEMVYGF